jgi:spore photoproduct lyase
MLSIKGAMYFSAMPSEPSQLSIASAHSARRKVLRSAINKGEFWKPCPGTTGGYLCCGYQIITPMIGCAMYCRYCVLQSYFDNEGRVRFENFEDLEHEIRNKLNSWNGIVRFGTGEFADSLHAEPETGVSVAVAQLLEPYSNVIVEFKTKSSIIEPLIAIGRPEKVIVAFSLNTPAMIDLMERDTAPLDDRFRAASRCCAMGFNVAFHFDPIIRYDGWETDYRRVVDRIYESVEDTRKIAWCSLGGFRSNPALKVHLKQYNEHLPLFSGEMITGNDGKLRYFRPLRVEIYKVMQEAFYRHQPDAPVYLCMESPEVWEESGMVGRIPEGLSAYLDERARVLLEAAKLKS